MNNNYGQITIYNNYFKNVDKKTIKYSPTECINNKKSYTATFNNRDLPIMIGSDLHIHNDNPLNIKGYFIIDGLFYVMNNIKFYYKKIIGHNFCYLNNGEKIEIKNMFEYYITKDNKKRKWHLPIDWKEIVENSEFKNRLYIHLNYINRHTNKKEKPIKNKIDYIILGYMFETWLKLREEMELEYRLLTSGEILYDLLNNQKDVISCFRTNNWKIKYINNVTTVSEQMKNFNIIGDIESTRKITLPYDRENTNIKLRKVLDKDYGKLCPVNSPDGTLCGTINYLVKNATLKTEKEEIILNGNKYYTFINSIYIGLSDGNYKNCIIYDKLCLIYNDIGLINKSKNMLSYTAEFIPYIKSNPPVRAMFACSMIKQAITEDKRILNNTKVLIKGNNDKNNAFPVNIGHTLNIAIMPWFGYNIEDALVINKSTSEKFRNKKYTIYHEVDIKIVNIYIKEKEYIKTNQKLFKTFNDKLIKTVNIIKAKNEGIVEKIEIKNNYIKVITSKTKNLEVGDKMASRHGQKGVISKIEDNENMPYYFINNKKVNIDLIMNPHAFPSRMTIGQIKEMMETGTETKVYINKILTEKEIQVGNCFYMALRHQVDDKVQYRIDGEIDKISKQPIGGKRNQGGLRFGQMERDILIASNNLEILKELWENDKTYIYECNGILNPKCECKTKRECHQYLIICLSYLRALNYDILWKNNKYSIIELNKNILNKTDNLFFGDTNPLDVRIYNDIVVLPMCLRNNKLNKLYYQKNIKEIEKETKKLLKNKNGAFHKYVEGHKVNNCIRSVITPNPNLNINEIEIPYNTKINCEYGILNRQPSLNENSMAIVKLKRGENKTISFNPLLCKSFNADFDGDEMNIYGLSKNYNTLKPKQEDTQDYIIYKSLNLNNLEELTYRGLTANKEGIELMINNKSKGKDFNIKHMFEKIEKINGFYWGDISNEEWYELSKYARE